MSDAPTKVYPPIDAETAMRYAIGPMVPMERLELLHFLGYPEPFPEGQSARVAATLAQIVADAKAEAVEQYRADEAAVSGRISASTSTPDRKGRTMTDSDATRPDTQDGFAGAETLLSDPTMFGSLVPAGDVDAARAALDATLDAYAAAPSEDRWKNLGRVVAAAAEAGFGGLVLEYGTKWANARFGNAMPPREVFTALEPYLVAAGRMSAEEVSGRHFTLGDQIDPEADADAARAALGARLSPTRSRHRE